MKPLSGEKLEKELVRLEAMREYEDTYDACAYICGIDESLALELEKVLAQWSLMALFFLGDVDSFLGKSVASILTLLDFKLHEPFWF